MFGLLAAPAQRLTDRPWTRLALSAVLAVGGMWAGLALAYAAPKLPASFAIMAIAAAEFALAALASTVLHRRPPRHNGSDASDAMVAGGRATIPA